QEIPQALEQGSLVHAEDGAQDHLEREAPEFRMDEKFPADGPPVDRRVGDVPYYFRVSLDPLTVERRLHHPALTQVARPVEQEERVFSEEMREERVRRARTQLVLVAREDLPDRLRVREDDERGPSRVERLTRDGREREGEAVAVLPRACFHERQRPANPL